MSILAMMSRAFAILAVGLIEGWSAAVAQTPYDTAMFRALQWRNVIPNRGGRATAGVGVPGNPRIYYMGAAGGGVWKTEDAGGRWHNISDGYIKPGSIGDIAVFDANPSIVYVGTGEGPVRGQMSSYGDGMYKSTDAGRTWTHVGLEKTRQISRVVVHPTDANIVYVAAQGSRWAPSEDRGIYRTTDGGATWKRVLFVSPSAGGSELVMDPTNPRVLYTTIWDFRRTPWAIRSGGPGSGIWKTTDGGDTWTQLKSGLPSLMGRIGLAIAPTQPNRLYGLLEADTGGFFRSDDAGASWKRVSSNRALLPRPWYFLSISVDPKNADMIYAPGFSLLRSSDGGVTWATRPSTHSDNHRLWINPTNGDNLILTNDGGAAVSFDGGDTWSTTANQATAQFYAVQTDDLFPYNLYAGQQDAGSVMMSSREAGGGEGWPQNWRSVGGGETAHFAYNPAKPDVVFATGFLGELHRHDQLSGFERSVTSFPGGQHLGSASIDLPYRYNWSAPLAWSPSDPRVMYHGANVVFRSTDGVQWTPISPDLTRNDKAHQVRSGLWWHDGSGGEIYNTITTIVESPRERGTIWVGTDDGLVQITRDNGATWKNVTPQSWGEGLVYNIDVGPHANGIAYVAFSRQKWDDDTPHLFVTRDYGATWTDLATGLPRDEPARVVREDPARKDLLFAGTEFGLWISFDGGKHWQSFQRGVPFVTISDLQLRHDDLVLATEGRGFWILDDMTPLRQLEPKVAAAPLFVFKPRPAVRVAGTPRGGGLAGTANIRYSLGRTLQPSDSLQLDILNASGAVVRHVATPGGISAMAGGGGGRGGRGGGRGGRGGDAAQLSTTRGLNQFAWDFRGREVSTDNLFAMRAGSYTIRMRLGATKVSQPLTVLADPRAGGSVAAEREHGSMSEALAGIIAHVNRLLAELRDARSQARLLAERARAAPVSERDAAMQSFIMSVDSLESVMVFPGPPGEPGPLDILHNTPTLGTDLSGLLSTIEGTSGPVTSGEREQLARLRARATGFISGAERVLTTGVAQVNALATASGLTPAIARHPAPVP
jgi:photosystem II stability/assembly factor-like uncharacterized protein